MQRSILLSGEVDFIRIGFITHDFYPPVGGQGVFSYELYNALAGIEGVEVSIASSRDNDIETHEQVKVTGRYGFGPLHFSLKINRLLKRFIEKEKVDILQVNGGPGGVFLLRKPGVPVVYVAHHTYGQQFEYLGRKPVYRILKIAEAIGYKLSARVVAVSTTTASSLVNDYGISPDRIKVIPDGVSSKFSIQAGSAREPLSILFVGRLCERKGLHFLVDAMGLVSREFPSVRLYIVGEGPLRDLLEAKVCELGIENNVTFVGKVTDEELVRWYNKVEVLVLPSFFEGFGMVCLEAMACGTPVIATKVPGIVDVVKDSEPCMLVEPGDSTQLAEAIVAYFSEGWNRHSGKRSFVPEGFDWQSIADRFTDIYNEALEAHEGGKNLEVG